MMFPRSVPPVATFSIVAADPAAGDVGVAVASKFMAAGAVVPWASAGAGAMATQSFADAGCVPRGMALMRAGVPAGEALSQLVAEMPEGSRRQFGIVDARGNAAALTEEGCFGWAGDLVGNGFACQGNILSGPNTLEAMARSFENTGGSLAQRLTIALAAGETAGGDRRGKQSAALYVAREGGGYLGKNDVLVDLRVDDAPEPVVELGRLFELHQLYFGSTPASEKISIADGTLSDLKTMLSKAGFDPGSGQGWDPTFEKALDALVAQENLEERFDFAMRTVDPPALAFLRTQYG